MAATKKKAPRKMVPKTRGGGGDSWRGSTVKVRPVSEPPAPQRGVSSRSLRYQKAMAQVRKKGKAGGWHEIATYASPAGAAVVRREILAGTRAIDGKVSDWVIESRRTHDDDGRVTGSALYVRLK